MYECEGIIDSVKGVFGGAKDFIFGDAGSSSIPVGKPVFSICPGCADSFDSATMPSSPTIDEVIAMGGGAPPLFFGKTAAPAAMPPKKSFLEENALVIGLGALGVMLIARKR